MARMTIDFGIDLGTTNSGVAHISGVRATIIKNNQDHDITPSVVYFDKKGAFHVGQQAKSRFENDAENTAAEFKLLMGSDATISLRRAGRAFRPEELSAEVLKSLAADVQKRLGEELTAAVITVPAAFELGQCEATRRAAELAGIRQSPLLQEPVAAALAYGFQEDATRARWLVFDFGGGTFDAAVLEVRDGSVQVVNHGGDNQLGGKLLDWDIVMELVVPELVDRYALPGFDKRDSKWRPALAKLKAKVEEAKIALSQSETYDLEVLPLCKDDDGEDVDVEIELRRADIERVAEPYLTRAVNICRKVLTEKGLGAEDVQKVILVGGPTKMPIFRSWLADAGTGLGIALEHRVDPLTVVAEGAAIFAGTQRREGVAAPKAAPGTTALELEYKPVGSDPEPFVGGRVVPAPRRAGYTVEFTRPDGKPPWRGGRVVISPEGVFMTQLSAEKGAPNHFRIELRDETGRQIPTVPDRIIYTLGLAFSEAPLTHSIGVAQADGMVDWVLKKGTPLPARAKTLHRLVAAARPGGDQVVLRVPVVEGESDIANRNSLIGQIAVSGRTLKRELPMGAEVEIEVGVDESRIVSVRAYVPMLDEEFDAPIELMVKIPDPAVLAKEVEAQRERLEEVREKIEEANQGDARAVLERVDEEDMEGEVFRALEAADGDPDSAQKCEQRLRDLKRALDEAERLVAPDSVRQEAQKALSFAEGMVEQHGRPEHKRRLATLRRELGDVLKGSDLEAIRHKKEDLRDLALALYWAQPDTWVEYLKYLKGQRKTMTDAGLAARYIDQGDRAVYANDLQALKAACQQLCGLLPPAEREAARGFGGTTLKH